MSTLNETAVCYCQVYPLPFTLYEWLRSCTSSLLLIAQMVIQHVSIPYTTGETSKASLFLGWRQPWRKNLLGQIVPYAKCRCYTDEHDKTPGQLQVACGFSITKPIKTVGPLQYDRTNYTVHSCYAKPTATQLDKKLPTLYGTCRFITVITAPCH
jgi:hypothetical protein